MTGNFPKWMSGATADEISALQELPFWKPIDANAMSGKPVIIAVVCAGREPVIGEATFYEEQDGWYWAGAAPNDHHCPGSVSDVNFGEPLYYQDLPKLPKKLQLQDKVDEANE